MDVGVEKLKEEVNKHIFKTSVVQNIQSNAGTLSLPFSRSGTKAAKYAALGPAASQYLLMDLYILYNYIMEIMSFAVVYIPALRYYETSYFKNELYNIDNIISRVLWSRRYLARFFRA
ncbi:MAG: hypothetical protein HDR12_15955 [Lachnospiraceae bacterium]|nr:hypothetical protein [Lachnospiraceae bacterium]